MDQSLSKVVPCAHEINLSESDLHRYWSKIDKNGPSPIEGSKCWVWLGSKDSDGYGVLSTRVNGRKGIRAHRIGFFLAYGEISKPCICHKCDNPPCVNPEHLFEGSHKENKKDCLIKGRANSPSGNDHWSRRNPHLVKRGATHYKTGSSRANERGIENSQSKLNDQKVREIRARHIPRRISQSMLAKEYGVTQSVISDVIRRISWTHVV